MNDFTASNGLRVHDAPHGNGWLHVRSGRAEQALHEIGPTELDALRQFFQAEADERLGRWRCPEVPDYLVYPAKSSHKVNVVRESDGETHLYGRNSPTFALPFGDHREWALAARAYFDAYPEPKPWHKAQPGEGWVIEIGSDQYPNPQAVVVSNDGEFLLRDGGAIAVDRSYIRSGRRFHPEVQS